MREGFDPEPVPPTREAKNQHTVGASVDEDADQAEVAEEASHWTKRDYTSDDAEASSAANDQEGVLDEANVWDSPRA